MQINTLFSLSDPFSARWTFVVTARLSTRISESFPSPLSTPSSVNPPCDFLSSKVSSSSGAVNGSSPLSPFIEPRPWDSHPSQPSHPPH
ncbi:Zinc finger protein Gfi1like [Caligus rogercresseyi]|uniref:Zinc finger protein Gfi1like n=1 Tax=Caligus rogercresseyi TaxID=217165 RepID=A0A7T8KJF0_CALRO|nr:Zinc finger protein Gfi1like [Caligus rogercresseyi]